MTTPRKNMALGQLYTNDIANRAILQVMAEVKREAFVPENLAHCAYVDEDLDVGNGRFLLAPMSFAKLLDLADITPDCRVLLVGCLSGYGAAVLTKLAAHVVAVDTDAALVEQARATLAGVKNLDLQVVEALPSGYGQSAPYNVIVVAGAVEDIPEILGNQLALDGRLVTIKNVEQRPGARGGIGRGMLVKRVHHQLHYREMFDASSAILPGFEDKPGFVF